jgi:hypothetical protein
MKATELPSYEEWRKKYNITVAEGVFETLRTVHGVVNPEQEIEFLIRQEYDSYLTEKRGEQNESN